MADTWVKEYKGKMIHGGTDSPRVFVKHSGNGHLMGHYATLVDAVQDIDSWCDARPWFRYYKENQNG